MYIAFVKDNDGLANKLLNLCQIVVNSLLSCIMSQTHVRWYVSRSLEVV